MTSTDRPFRHLCPEADLRDAMDDGEFWAHVLAGPEPDFEDWLAWNTPTPDDLIGQPCPVCHAMGACGYDDEGRALIHSLNTDDAAESAVEEVVGHA